MRTAAKRSFLLLLLAGCATGGAGVIPKIDALMTDYAGDVPGASVLVITNGRAIERSYGLANLEQRTLAAPETNYRLASVTKQFTAAAILLLAEDDRLTVDDRVKRWLPSLPPAADSITIRHLLTHTSGLLDYEDFVPETAATQVRDAGVLDILEAHDRTYFAPGSAYRYSNSGYALLALIIEEASGTTFQSFLRDRIFRPLGMNDTVAHVEGESTVTHRAFGYSLTDGRWVRTDQSPTSAVLGDGGIYSSVRDLAKWDAALAGDRLLSRESLRAAFSPATKTDEPGVDYGFGWRISGDSLWHSGETRGFRNVIVRFPSRGLTVVILTNRNGPRPYQTALKIAELF